MKYSSLLALSFLLLLNVFSLMAQDTSGYVYVDSSIVYPGSEAEKIVASPQEEKIITGKQKSGEVAYADTSLSNNHLFIPVDSINAIKNFSSFAYAKKLDSLLRDYQAKERARRKVSERLSWLAIFFSSELTKIFFWILAIFFICFIVYKLFFTEGVFQRSAARSKVSLLDEHDTDIKKAADYERLIAIAAAKNDFRLAVRYLYLQSLQQLAASGVIILAADKTNTAYLRELGGKPYKSEFAALTLYYEYIWYGDFKIDEQAFLSLQKRFRELSATFIS